MTETHAYSFIIQGEPDVLAPVREKLVTLAVDTFLAGASILKIECVISDSIKPTAPSKPERRQKPAAAPQPATTTKRSRAIAKWSTTEISELVDKFEFEYKIKYAQPEPRRKLNSLIVNRLRDARITTVGQLLELSPSDLLSISKFGVGMLARLEEMLALQRLKLQPDED